MLIPFLAPLLVHPDALVRVDIADYAGAEASSPTGSVLLQPPPAGVPWTVEEVPEPDRWTAVEALTAMNVEPWHDRGITGQGVKIAVFDIQWYGVWTDEAVGQMPTHDCWRHHSCAIEMDNTRPRFKFEEGVHGFACAEVIHDIAPDAEIHLVRVNGSTTLESAVAWAVREEIDLISMSMSFFNGSYYDGTGRNGRLMDDLVSGGVLMVSSAGNYARGHWEGSYVDADLDGYLDFGGDNGLDIYFNKGDNRGVYVQWDEYNSCGTSDLSASLWHADGYRVGLSDNEQSIGADRCNPVERARADIEEDGWYTLRVSRTRGAGSDLHVNVLATDGRVQEDLRMEQGSIAEPGSHPGVLTVGAVRGGDFYALNDAEGFSSRGPTLGGHRKPDIAGPDGLSTDAYGPVGFFGTSAATPAVVGALALVMADDPSLTSFEASDRLRGWALTDDPRDPRWGDGKARLPVSPDDPAECGRGRMWLAVLLPPVLLWPRRRKG